MGYAFISYSTKNQSNADALKQLFERKGIRTWMAPGDIPAGSKYAQVINQAIKECSCFVLLLTDAAQKSVWVSKEVERAVHYGKTVIPIIMEELVLNDEFEFYISTDQIVSVQKIDESSESLQKVLSTVTVLAGKTTLDTADEETVPPRTDALLDIPIPPPLPSRKDTASRPAPSPKGSAAEDGKDGSRKVSFVHRERGNILIFNHFFLSELLFYGMGLFSYVMLLFVDLEFAIPLLLLCIALGLIPASARRLAMHKPLLPPSQIVPQITVLPVFAYTVCISYAWAADMQFYSLFEDYFSPVALSRCREIETPLLLAFIALGIAVSVGLLLALRKRKERLLSCLVSLLAFVSLTFGYFYADSFLITGYFLGVLHDPDRELVFLVLSIVSALICMLLLAAVVFMGRKKSKASKK